MNSAFATLFNMMYPVGSIYMSATLSDASAVNSALPGTWQAWGAGRVPVGVDTSDADFDTAEETGGEKTHVLASGETPKRDFYVGHIANADNNYGAIAGVSVSRYASSGTYREQGQAAGSNANAWRFTFGNNEAHNNLQPYITCYMYKRVS
jgi:microcystin-dependent protein